MPYSCCVSGCVQNKDNTATTFHRLPSNKNICDVWLDRIGRSDLKKFESEELFSNYRICGKHFSEYNRSPGTKRLKNYSLPTLHLPDFRETPTVENSFLIPKSSIFWEHPDLLGVDSESNVSSINTVDNIQLRIKEEILSDVEDVDTEEHVIPIQNEEHSYYSSFFDHDYVLKRPKIELNESSVTESSFESTEKLVHYKTSENFEKVNNMTTNVVRSDFSRKSAAVGVQTEFTGEVVQSNHNKKINSSKQLQNSEASDEVITAAETTMDASSVSSQVLNANESTKKNARKNFISPTPKTFVFKKNKNLGLIIKSALKQCNFPKGTRLIRSIDFVEKGKAMYRIVLPAEDEIKTIVKENKRSKLRAEANRNSEVLTKQIFQKSSSNRSLNLQSKKGNTEDVNEMAETPAGAENSVEKNSASKDVTESKEKLRNISIQCGIITGNEEVSESFNTKSKINPVLLNKNSQEYENLQPRFHLPRNIPLPDEVLRAIEFKIPGINRLQKSVVWNRIANAIGQKLKMHYKRKQEYTKKIRAKRLVKIKERMKKDLLNELKDTHYIMDDENIAKHIDTLFYKAKINSYISKLIFIMHKFSLLKRNGRRYTVGDKLFSFSLYKSIGKHDYIQMEKLLPLPSRVAMFSLLNKIPFSPGLNRQVFENLRKSVEKLSDEEKYCSLMFDEIALAEDTKEDTAGQNELFKNVIKTRPSGDHVLVLMLRGVIRNWKQPIAFIVHSGSVDFINLVQLIKESIKLTIEINLKPIATIFNKKNSYIEAIKYLKLETEAECLNRNIDNTYFGFLIDNVEIVPLFNSFQLLKETKDALVSFDIEYTQKDERKTASWEHLLQLYSADQGDESIRVCPRLTEQNIVPKKMIQLREENCSPIFSQRVASVMKILATLSAKGLESKASETADFLLLMDQILDSCSGCASNPPAGKPLKALVRKRSKHSQFWTEAIEIISSFKYLNRDMNYVSLAIGDNWITTLLGYLYLTDKVLKQNVNSLPMRNLNTEPLDKFVNALCSERQKPKYPTYYYFLLSYRNFVLSNNILNNNCFLMEESEFEVPLDINRDYVYDERPVDDEDIMCCVHDECSS